MTFDTIIKTALSLRPAIRTTRAGKPGETYAQWQARQLEKHEAESLARYLAEYSFARQPLFLHLCGLTGKR